MRKHWVVLSVMMGAVTWSANGQLLPPAPAKTPATPDYTPPPPPPTPPPAPTRGPGPTTPAPQEAVPSIVEKDEAGKLKLVGMASEEAAIRALKLDEETMTKVETSLASRREDLDRLVVDNFGTLKELRQFVGTMSAGTSIDDFSAAGKKTHVFRTFPSVLDRLSRDGAINPQMKSRASRVAQEYNKAWDSELQAGVDHSKIQEGVIIGFRRHYAVSMLESQLALDRMVAAAAPQADALVGKMQVPADRRAAIASKMRTLPREGADRAKALKDALFDVFEVAESQQFLRLANPKLEAKPAAEKVPEADKK